MLQFDYLRPQLVRDGWASLNGEWDLAFDDARRHRGPQNAVDWTHRIEDPRYLYWAEAIERDYSHPCVIVWVPFNESWGVPNLTAMQAHRNAVEALYHLTRMLDATRPVIGNDGWEASATDILGIHDYDGDPHKLRARYEAEHQSNILFDRRRPGGRILTLDGFPHRGQPIVLTEFCGVAYDPRAPEHHTWGYSRTNTAEAFHALYRDLLRVVNETAMFSGFCYTQFADTFQETNGLLNADRSPKIPLEQISAATRNVPH